MKINLFKFNYFYITMRIIFLLILLLFSFQALGQGFQDAEEGQFFKYQTLKNRWHISGNFGIGLGFRNKSLSLNNSTVLVDVSFNPKIGIFLIERLQTGVAYDYHASVTSFGEKNDYAVFSSVIGAYTRYYTPKGFFAELQYGVGGGRERFRNGSNQQIDFGINTQRFSGGIGIASFWTKRFNFEIMLRYSRASNKNTDTSERFTSSRLAILGGLSVALGK
jgi:hypothetical protein